MFSHLITRSAVSAASFAIVWAAVLAPVANAQDHDEGHDMHDGHESAAMHYVADLETLESKFLDLADAMSQEQYLWRPMEGVRSVSEVFMLIVGENYLIPRAWGVDPPSDTPTDMTFRSLREVTDKAEVVNLLRASFAHYKEVIGNLTNEDLEREIQFFGQERTIDAALFLMSGDMHEHLGQSIAYARTNHVVPPWTARAQANQ